MTNEHPTNRTAGSVAQIACNGFSHVDRQGQEDGLATLAANGYQALLPIHVLQVQPDLNMTAALKLSLEDSVGSSFRR